MDIINMLGQPCPLPVIKAKKALRQAAGGDEVNILVDNDIARRNLEKMAAGLGHAFSSRQQADDNILVTITVGVPALSWPLNEPELVVAIGRETMGSGSEELGKMLMKSFIQCLTEFDVPPARILFFNGGVLLTTEGSGALDDLKLLAEKGSAISSCGACLNYYGLVEKLKAGSITDMLAIAGTMAQASRLVNL